MNEEHLALGSGGEFDRLRAIYERLGESGHSLGDDCALLGVQNATLAVSIDLSIEGVHFRRDWMSATDIGYRAASAALSDLAAEGGRPAGLLVSLGVPDRGEIAPDIMAGVGECATEVGAKVLGGDLTQSDRIIVDVCVIGTAPRPIRRIGAQVGDGVWVTGSLGAMRLALNAYRGGRRPSPDIARRFARPTPRLAAGQWLAAQGATAMIDLSDGLTGDAGHLAAASRVAMEVALERVPCWLGAEPLVAAASGEEYELLVTMPARFGDKQAQAFTEQLGLALTRIGSCLVGSGVRFTDRGNAVRAPAGYDHFAE